ncbi:MAG: amidase [Gemmatimonadales bacterium]
MPEPTDSPALPDPFDRRAFLSHAAMLGAAATGGLGWPPASRPSGRIPSLVSAPKRATASLAPFELEEITIAELQAGMASGRYTAKRVVELYLERIAAMDRTDVALQSIIETNPEAIALAEALDQERAAKGPRGPLHGVPVLLKDNIDTADRMTTTAGSFALEGSIPPQDAHLAERLRAAGAILLAKANMSEWANIRSNHSSSGWSARGGQCRNPFVLDRNPCGSSSGSAAAVSANFGAVAVGTETDGSIVCPASACGVVGLKPTVGLVSRAGVIPISHTQDTAGPLCRTVADAASLLSALAGGDPRDAATAAASGHVEADYTKFCDPAGLRGARIGVARAKFFGYSDVTDRLAEAALGVFRREGAIVVDPADIPHAGEYDGAELDVLLFELKADLNAYLGTLGPTAPVRTLADVIAFNERDKAREMPWFGQELFVQAEAKGPLTTPAYRRALDTCARLSRRHGLDAVMDKHRLDAIVAPTGNPAWPTDPVNGDHFTGGSSTPAAVAGYPSISVPMGQAWGLPVNLSFIGRAWSEPTLIRLAYAFEQITMHRKAPRFLSTLA